MSDFRVHHELSIDIATGQNLRMENDTSYEACKSITHQNPFSQVSL